MLVPVNCLYGKAIAESKKRQTVSVRYYVTVNNILLISNATSKMELIKNSNLLSFTWACLLLITISSCGVQEKEKIALEREQLALEKERLALEKENLEEKRRLEKAALEAKKRRGHKTKEFISNWKNLLSQFIDSVRDYDINNKNDLDTLAKLNIWLANELINISTEDVDEELVQIASNAVAKYKQRANIYQARIAIINRTEKFERENTGVKVITKSIVGAVLTRDYRTIPGYIIEQKEQIEDDWRKNDIDIERITKNIKDMTSERDGLEVKLASRYNIQFDDKISELFNDKSFEPESANTNTTQTNSIATNEIPQQTIQQASAFPESSFPRASCGDLRPLDSSEYPIDFYPVYIDFSEKNLEKVKTNFCRDSYTKKRELTGKKSIKVASFSNYKKAEDFQDIMSDKFGNAEIGEPNTITELD